MKGQWQGVASNMQLVALLGTSSMLTLYKSFLLHVIGRECIFIFLMRLDSRLIQKEKVEGYARRTATMMNGWAGRNWWCFRGESYKRL